ncbi:hypothetical protein NA57DRAFT_53537 [Rhizodiscina lignyota]|uniref:Uncharacterized protein n=1 Tax=Rhizodiscina lignyota TaxID=1504668 RepID=A0A9P4INX6_9PEZI|nr:hypothetical protein NA57DRAFT_53537 [Rhizodiscina lignyota]
MSRAAQSPVTHHHHHHHHHVTSDTPAHPSSDNPHHNRGSSQQCSRNAPSKATRQGGALASEIIASLFPIRQNFHKSTATAKRSIAPAFAAYITRVICHDQPVERYSSQATPPRRNWRAHMETTRAMTGWPRLHGHARHVTHACVPVPAPGRRRGPADLIDCCTRLVEIINASQGAGC